MSKELKIKDSIPEFLIYKSPDGNVKIDVLIKNKDIWLNQKEISNLFGVKIPAISKHLSNIFEEGELIKNATVSKMEIVQNENGRNIKRQLDFYNLEAIIAIGYRINSKQATNFRIWSNNVLKEYIIKGFVMDDERLKNPYKEFGEDFFEEQLERIRNIRNSERRFYQKITDIYSQCSIDYDPKTKETQNFFATIQNKLHFAITGNTAAELIHSRVSHKKENIGLTSWKFSPDGPIRKNDVNIAKNYLNEKELNFLNRIVVMYLDYAEMQSIKGIPMTMKDWKTKLNAFLQFNEREILSGSGKITAEIAKSFAESEFEKFRVIQDREYESDFDKMISRQLKLNKTK